MSSTLQSRQEIHFHPLFLEAEYTPAEGNIFQQHPNRFNLSDLPLLFQLALLRFASPLPFQIHIQRPLQNRFLSLLRHQSMVLYRM